MTTQPNSEDIATILSWFHDLEDGAGANVRAADLGFFAMVAHCAKNGISNDIASDPSMQKMREALETVLKLGGEFLTSGQKALINAEASGMSDGTLDTYRDAQKDLWAVVETTRTLLLNGRFRYLPTRKRDLRGYWHKDALTLAYSAADTITRRGNQAVGVRNPTSAAIAVTLEALKWIYGKSIFTAEQVVRAIERLEARNNSFRKDVESRARRFRCMVLPDAGEHPGTMESKHAADD